MEDTRQDAGLHLRLTGDLSIAVHLRGQVLLKEEKGEVHRRVDGVGRAAGAGGLSKGGRGIVGGGLAVDCMSLDVEFRRVFW